MAGLSWRPATVSETVMETPRTRTLGLAVDGWSGHRPGQHVDLRVTADDGYSAYRSYSIASAPGEPTLRLTVERIDEGEVSPYLVDVAEPGDQVEVRGPIGGYFVWECERSDPLLLVAGGSGVVPLMAMLRYRHRSGCRARARLILSSATESEIIYRRELDTLAAHDDGFDVVHTLTRQSDGGWPGPIGRIDAGLLADHGFPAREHPGAFVCGPSGLVELTATALVNQGYETARVRTERFGPTGGRGGESSA